MLGTGAAHALCLAEITYLTQTYPAEVRNMFSEQPHLQQRLATAIRSEHGFQTEHFYFINVELHFFNDLKNHVFNLEHSVDTYLLVLLV